MTHPVVTPYGSWRSPITAEMVASKTISLSEPAVVGDDVYWIEQRPTEGGRYVLVRRSGDGQVRDAVGASINVRTRVHEYGGAAYAVDDRGVVVANFDDQRLYRVVRGGPATPLTAPGFRYADGCIDRARRRMICVREDHTAGAGQPVNTIAGVPLDGGRDAVLVSGSDFYAAPRLSPDGRRLAWLCWHHPHMPWDRTELWTAEIRRDGSPAPARRIAGGADESLCQPEWDAEGRLYFVSDCSGWWNLYRAWAGGVEALCERAADFGQPAWRFGTSTYAVVGGDVMVCAWSERGQWRIGLLDTVSGVLREIDLPYTHIRYVRGGGHRAVFVGGCPTEPTAVVLLDADTLRADVLRRSTDVSVDRGYLSVPRAIEFATKGDRTAHALFYPPTNRDHRSPAGERPPLIVHSHGGPTGAAGTAMDLSIQFWTSRGFAVVDVNYGGSTGYGREYRRRLAGQWGVVDVDDCVQAALHLADRGLADRRRLAIAGGSAGGYTTLCALTFRDVFGAGASYFGVSDCAALARETHKFESRYLDWLIAPYAEHAELYRRRSPIHFAQRLSCPVIFFQGLEDKVVPPNQAERMVRALRENGLPVAYVPFEGEQHGFRRADTLRRALEAELYFYARVFGFEPADRLEPVEIANL